VGAVKGVDHSSELRPGPFISYAREDQDFVRQLHDALLERGRDPWVDWEIFPSTEWMREVRSAIDAAPAVIFLISPDSISSPVCRQELDHALAQNKRLVPVVCRAVNPDGVDESVRKLNWISVLNPDELQQKVEQLIQVMDADLDWVHAHARLLVRARDWEAKAQDRSLLLHGNDLKDSERWLVNIGADRTPRPTALQTQYVIASRRAQTTRQRYVLAAVGAALIVTTALAVYASVQSHIADHQRDVALSRLLAAQSLKNSSEAWGQLDLALLLSVAAHRLQPTLEAEGSLFRALIEANRVRKFVPSAETLVSLAVSPDGSIIASGDFHGGIVLRGAKTLEARATMQHGEGVVESISFSPDGGTLASAGSGRIVLWDALSGRERGALEGGHEYVRRVVWHPDGSTLFSASRNEPDIFVWDVATGSRRTSIPGDPLIGLAISPDGGTIASAADWEREVRLWDVANHQERMVLRGHQGAVRAVAFSRDGTLLASASEDSRIIIWDVASGTPRMKLEGQAGRIDCVAFSPDGKRLASGSDNRTIMLWDLASGKPLELLFGHTNGVMNVAFTPDGNALVSNAFDSTLIVWDAGTPRQRALLTGHEGDVRTVAVSPDGATLASGGDDHTVRLWDAASGRQRALLAEHQGEVHAVAFSPDGGTLASVSDDDHRIVLWDVASARKLREIDGDEDVTTVAFSPDGRTLASGAELKASIFLWDVATGQRQAELRGHESDVDALEFSRDGKVLVSGGGEGSIRVWDLATRTEMVEPMGAGGSVARVAISPDGKSLASSAHLSGTLLLWDLWGQSDPVELDTRGLSGAPSVAYSPEGRTLAYTSGELQLNIVLWDLASRTPRATLEARATTLSMAFTPDGTRLVTGHSNGDVALWDVDLEGWPRRACELANRDLTRDEWTTFVGEDLPYRAVCPELPVATN
jgi:WD40 repeat protein